VHRISTERRYSPPLPSPSLPSYSHPPCCCCCCCCCDEDTLPIWGRGDNNVSKRWGILPDSESGGNRLSLIVVSLTVAPLPRWHHCHGGTTATVAVVAHSWHIVDHCPSMLTVDTLSSCSQFPAHLQQIKFRQLVIVFMRNMLARMTNLRRSSSDISFDWSWLQPMHNAVR